MNRSLGTYRLTGVEISMSSSNFGCSPPPQFVGPPRIGAPIHRIRHLDQQIRCGNMSYDDRPLQQQRHGILPDLRAGHLQFFRKSTQAHTALGFHEQPQPESRQTVCDPRARRIQKVEMQIAAVVFALVGCYHIGIHYQRKCIKMLNLKRAGSRDNQL